MSWLLGLGVVIGVLVLIVKGLSALAPESTGNGGADSESYTTRGGREVKTDAVFRAWTSGDLSAMLNVLDKKTNLVDRHHLLQAIVNECYRNRTDPSMRDTCLRVARLHLSEFPAIARALKREDGGILPRVTTFQHLATLLSEDGEFDDAIEVCRSALHHGLDDGTKSGYEGRIKRIAKKAKP